MSAQLKIALLLSTYNGEKFLREQLDSLLAQSHGNFILVARDDGSHDGTVSILENYARDHSERIRLLPRDDENKGASGGFTCLINGLYEAHIIRVANYRSAPNRIQKLRRFICRIIIDDNQLVTDVGELQ